MRNFSGCENSGFVCRATSDGVKKETKYSVYETRGQKIFIMWSKPLQSSLTLQLLHLREIQRKNKKEKR